MPTKKLKEIKFSYSLVNGEARPIPIEGTEFTSLSTSEEFHSCYNKDKNPVVNKVLGFLADKTGRAIASAKHAYGADAESNYFAVTYNGKNAILLIDKPDSSEEITFTVVSYSKTLKNVTGIMTNDTKSYALFKALLAYRLYVGDREAKSMFGSIELNHDDIIASSQGRPLFTLADNLFCLAKDMTKNGVMVSEGNTKAVSKELGDSIDWTKAQNINSVIGSETPTTSEGCKSLGISAISFGEMAPDKSTKKARDTRKARKAQIVEGKLRINNATDASWDATLADGFAKASAEFKAGLDLLDDAEVDTAYGMAKGWIKSLGLVGPAGTGKTKLAAQIAGACGLPLVVVHGSENLSEADIIGSMELMNEGGVTVTAYKARPLLKAYEQGGLVFFDEVNTVSSGVLNVLNSILDGNGSFTFGDKVFHQHPNFRFICAWNNGYTGTNQLSPSFKDRLESKMMLARFSDEKIASIVEEKCGFRNFDIIKKMWSIEEKAETFIKDVGDPLSQVSSVRRIIAWVNRASMTGEFVRASLTTFMPDICSDGAVSAYTVEAFMSDQIDEFVPVVMQDIQCLFEDTEYENEIDEEDE